MNNAPHPLTIGIVAGEPSGDALGADFIKQMRTLYPTARFVGVGGEQMIQAGLKSMIDINRLSVMGVMEVIKHLPDLLLAKREILAKFGHHHIDVFVGIDSPDFNLRLAQALKPAGIFCVQYVSPSIWAWRENRIHTIKRATHLVLCLFPFELSLYAKYQHPAICVGHPLTKQLISPTQTERLIIKNQLSLALNMPKPNIAKQGMLICLMAGSRHNELAAILPTLLQSMVQLIKTHPAAEAILPIAKDTQRQLMQSLIDKNAAHIRHKLHIITPSQFCHTLTVSQAVMAISDVTLIASGTATLEAVMLGIPMVVVYKVNPITYQIAKQLIHTPYISLPNLLNDHLFGKPISAELIQHHATPVAICQHALTLLDNPSTQQSDLLRLAGALRQECNNNPAHAVLTAYQDHL